MLCDKIAFPQGLVDLSRAHPSHCPLSPWAPTPLHTPQASLKVSTFVLTGDTGEGECEEFTSFYRFVESAG